MGVWLQESKTEEGSVHGIPGGKRLPCCLQFHNRNRDIHPTYRTGLVAAFSECFRHGRAVLTMPRRRVLDRHVIDARRSSVRTHLLPGPCQGLPRTLASKLQNMLSRQRTTRRPSMSGLREPIFTVFGMLSEETIPAINAPPHCTGERIAMADISRKSQLGLAA
jgi:hypothetical protein